MFCKGFWGKTRKFFNRLDKTILEYSEMALSITTSLKSILGNDLAVIATAIIPGDIDELIRTRLLKALDKTISALTIIEACKDFATIDERLTCFAEQMRKLNPELQEALLIKMASLITADLHGGQLPRSDYDTILQVKFKAEK